MFVIVRLIKAKSYYDRFEGVEEDKKIVPRTNTASLIRRQLLSNWGRFPYSNWMTTGKEFVRGLVQHVPHVKEVEEPITDHKDGRTKYRFNDGSHIEIFDRSEGSPKVPVHFNGLHVWHGQPPENAEAHEVEFLARLRGERDHEDGGWRSEQVRHEAEQGLNHDGTKSRLGMRGW